MRRLTVELYRGRGGKFGARIRGFNGKILYRQSELVNRRAHARKIAEQLINNMYYARLRTVEK